MISALIITLLVGCTSAMEHKSQEHKSAPETSFLWQSPKNMLARAEWCQSPAFFQEFKNYYNELEKSFEEHGLINPEGLPGKGSGEMDLLMHAKAKGKT